MRLMVIRHCRRKEWWGYLDIIIEMIQNETCREKGNETLPKKKHNISDLWDNFKQSKTCVLTVFCVEEEEKGKQKILKK